MAHAMGLSSASDIGAAIKYYQNVLGFAEGWKRGMPPVIAQVLRDDVEVHLTRRVGSNTSSVYLYVQGVDAYTQLSQLL